MQLDAVCLDGPSSTHGGNTAQRRGGRKLLCCMHLRSSRHNNTPHEQQVAGQAACMPQTRVKASTGDCMRGVRDFEHILASQSRVLRAHRRARNVNLILARNLRAAGMPHPRFSLATFPQAMVSAPVGRPLSVPARSCGFLA